LKSKNQFAIISLLVAVILGGSSLFVYAQEAAPANWVGVDGNYPYNWDYVQQNQISASNVNTLSVSWLYPIPSSPGYYAPVVSEGVLHTPIVVNGIAYAITNYHVIVALNLKTGSILWQKSLPILRFHHQFFDPYCCGIQEGIGSNLTGHYHAIWYTSKVQGTPLVWILSNNFTMFAFNGLTGDLTLKFDLANFNKPIDGNFGNYGTITPQIAIDENTGIMISGSAVSEGTNAGRGFFQGWDVSLNPPRLLWQKYMIPPQDGSDPLWSFKSVQNMSYAYIFNGTSAVDLKALPLSQQHSILDGDWGNFGFNGTRSWAGAGTGWGGSWALDPSTGIAYVGTAQPSPDYNTTGVRPGPNLWSDSILAVNEKTGNFVWGFQATSHDLWDWDCSWSVMLATVNINGSPTKVVYKGCKDGILHALDAATGKLLWYFNDPHIVRPVYSWPLLDPRNPSDMKKPWANYPAIHPFVQNPSYSGAIESNPAYDPTSNTVFVATFNAPITMIVNGITGKGVPWGGQGSPNDCCNRVPPFNTTISALDGSTGKLKWSYYLGAVGYRGGITVSNGVLYVPSPDGNLYFIDSLSGKLIGSKFIGASFHTQPALAADVDGTVHLIMPTGGPTGAITPFAAGVPGVIFALSLPSGAAVTTSVSTSVSTVVSTVLSTVQGPATGIDPTTFYGVTAVAAIFIIATGILTVRRRRPAS